MINKRTKKTGLEPSRTSFEFISLREPDGMKRVENDPKKNINRLVRAYQDSSRMIQDIFNNIDPLGTLKSGVGTYTGCAERFMEQLDNQHLTDLSRDQIETMVRNSFHEGQIGTPVSEVETKRLVDYIDSLKNLS